MSDARLDDAFYETFGLLRARVHEQVDPWVIAGIRTGLFLIWREERALRLWDSIAPQVNR